MAKEKINHKISTLEYTHLPAVFYYKNKILQTLDPDGLHPSPVQYFDEINKKLLDDHFEKIFMTKSSLEKEEFLEYLENLIIAVSKTVWHGFEYKTVVEWLRDAGTAVKMRDVFNSKYKKIETLDQLTEFCKTNKVEHFDIFLKVDCVVSD